MTIAHQRLANDFTQISKDIFRHGMSAQATGVLCYLLGKPANWKVRPNELAKVFGCDRKRIYRILGELIEAGYIRKHQERDAVTNRWLEIEYTVLPIRGATLVAQPLPQKPLPQNGTLLTTDSTNTDSTKNNRDSHPFAGAKAHAHDLDELKSGTLSEAKESKEESGNVGTRSSPPRSSNRKRSPRMYRQSQAEAAIAFDELQKLEGWCGTWGDDELTHWHALLRRGYAADHIVTFAEAFLNETADVHVPSLGDFLQCFESHVDDAIADYPEIAFMRPKVTDAGPPLEVVAADVEDDLDDEDRKAMEREVERYAKEVAEKEARENEALASAARAAEERERARQSAVTSPPRDADALEFERKRQERRQAELAPTPVPPSPLTLDQLREPRPGLYGGINSARW